jgi:Uncharacterized conserved protein (DUF2075)
MFAYYGSTLAEFVAEEPKAVVGQLQTKYANDGYATQFLTQTRAWAEFVPLFQAEVRSLLQMLPRTAAWTILLEFPLYRLQRRIDAVVLAGSAIVVIEVKVGEHRFVAGDERQVEEYALDLRDFHEGSRGKLILPVLWSTHAPAPEVCHAASTGLVAPIRRVGGRGLARLLSEVATLPGSSVDAAGWDTSGYRPVPSVIQAATTIFAGHDVRSIAQADASNLREAAARLVELIARARLEKQRALIFLTGVPGSGKTLAGLQAVHDAITTGDEHQGDIVYLSGNTPLVTVLREALARNQCSRLRGTEKARPLHDIRREVRARIQHINDYLKQYLRSDTVQAPHEHAIIFDEAQRAWDEKQGLRKFSRTASEPALLLDLMGRHRDWCACVCLVGGGQEINSGERGVSGWGDAVRALAAADTTSWVVFAPPDVLSGGPSTGGDCLGELPPHVAVTVDPMLQLEVPLRTFRSPILNAWVASVLSGESTKANAIASQLGNYPVMLTRSLGAARAWLRYTTRGERRCGLLASSGARRLRADGLGEILNATDGADIAHWYLNPPGDIRASSALEVPANEYTCQGLELDFVAICWGGNMVRDPKAEQWLYRRLNGSRWQTITDPLRRRFVENAYRVLLTRAREGLIIWVPRGDAKDKTREPELLDAAAAYLVSCGALEHAPVDEVAA